MYIELTRKFVLYYFSHKLGNQIVLVFFQSGLWSVRVKEHSSSCRPSLTSRREEAVTLSLTSGALIPFFSRVPTNHHCAIVFLRINWHHLLHWILICRIVSESAEIFKTYKSKLENTSKSNTLVLDIFAFESKRIDEVQTCNSYVVFLLNFSWAMTHLKMECVAMLTAFIVSNIISWCVCFFVRP